MSVAARRATTAAVLAVVAGAIVLLWPTVLSLVRQWTDTENRTYTHGFLIAALSLWLLWRNAAASRVAPAPDWRVVVPLALASFAWLIALRAGIEIVHQLLLPLLLFLALCAALGLNAGRRYAFACAFLYFANSIWSVATGTLQSISVHAVKLMLSVTALPAFVEGNTVHIPEGAFEVEGGCSGLHFFMVALALAALFGEIHHDRWKTRAWQIALGALVAMLANWVRIFIVIIAGHATDMQHYLVRVDHYYFGWGVFAVAMGGYFWLLSRTSANANPESDAGAAPAAPMSTRPLATAIALGVAGLGAGPLLGFATPLRPLPAHDLSLPAIAGWAGPAARTGAWSPNYPHADRRAAGTYAAGGAFVAAFVAEYDEQHQDKELIGYGNSLRDGLDAGIEDSHDVSAARGVVRVQRLSDERGAKSVLAFFYRIGSRRIVTGMSAQLHYALTTLGGPVSSRVVAVYAPCGTDCDAAERRALQLIDALDANHETGEVRP